MNPKIACVADLSTVSSFISCPMPGHINNDKAPAPIDFGVTLPLCPCVVLQHPFFVVANAGALVKTIDANIRSVKTFFIIPPVCNNRLPCIYLVGILPHDLSSSQNPKRSHLGTR